jgi:flagellar biogenesis protein FliO
MKPLKRFFLFLLLVLIFVAAASEAGGQEEATGFMEPLSKAEGKGMHERGAQVLGFFLLVGGVAYGTMCWQKRRGKHHGKTIQVVAVKPLGQREKVAILEVLGERMVLGITAHRISLLSQGPVSFSRIMGEEDKTA